MPYGGVGCGSGAYGASCRVWGVTSVGYEVFGVGVERGCVGYICYD